MASFQDLKRKLIKGEIEEPIETKEIKPIEPQSIFELEEARYMLNLIANNDFKGRDIQVVYNIALKLQDILTKNTTE